VPRINEHYLNLQASYLFAEVKRRTQAFRDAHPDARVISLGIGDVTRPLPPAVVHALEQAAREQGRAETLKGYGPYVGYEFLRAEIAAFDFGSRGVGVTVDEIFVSDGGKSDSANLQEIFASECVVALMDPVYPVYADSNVIAGRSGRADASGRYAGFTYLPCTAENDFLPALPDRRVDLIYLCYPNNPTGAVMTREAL
jgi:LL-diaminopimelate aminotransferase